MTEATTLVQDRSLRSRHACVELTGVTIAPPPLTRWATREFRRSAQNGGAPLARDAPRKEQLRLFAGRRSVPIPVLFLVNQPAVFVEGHRLDRRAFIRLDDVLSAAVAGFAGDVLNLVGRGMVTDRRLHFARQVVE